LLTVAVGKGINHIFTAVVNDVCRPAPDIFLCFTLSAAPRGTRVGMAQAVAGAWGKRRKCGVAHFVSNSTAINIERANAPIRKVSRNGAAQWLPREYPRLACRL
jgi:hypothetical protein